MTPEIITPPPAAVESLSPTAAVLPPRRPKRTPFHAHGEPKLWLTGGALVVCVFMIVGLLALIIIQGAATFWPSQVTEFKTFDGHSYMGEITRSETYKPTQENLDALPPEARDRAAEILQRNDGSVRRRLVRTGNFRVTGTHFTWLSDLDVKEESKPDFALTIERLEWGRLYGSPQAFLERHEEKDADGKVIDTTWVTLTQEPTEVWAKFLDHHDEVRERLRQRVRLEKKDQGVLNQRKNEARIAARSAELKYGADSEESVTAAEQYESVQKEVEEKSADIRVRIQALNKENDRFKLVVRTADGKDQEVALADIVRAYPANRSSFGQKLGVYRSRWWEFLSDDPRESNSEGGVFPAIWGTVAMTLLMSLAVVPLGVLAALYLREYAKFGPMISAVRIAMNNLAGVPSIVFGVFGLGFFCYFVGGHLDNWFYAAEKPNPHFGTGGLMWASLTMALLTLPVVIVTTEEALAAVANSLREGSYACGASKWQTIWRIVLPRAMPGILTGTILAMSRGAGEVAPLMLVGVVKLAPSLPVDSVFPYVHPERSFMHLGFHIADVGMQSQDAEAAKPMVYTTTLLLIVIIVALNLTAILVRARLRRRHAGGNIH